MNMETGTLKYACLDVARHFTSSPAEAMEIGDAFFAWACGEKTSAVQQALDESAMQRELAALGAPVTGAIDQ